jgi:recombination protein RecT
VTSPQTTKTGEIVPRNGAAKTDLPAMLEKLRPEIARAVPRHINPDRMLRIALTCLRMNEDLMKCSPASFLGAVMAASQLGLEIGGPLAQAYLLPFKQECTLVVGYRGMLNLARRSGLVTSIYAYEVREGDKFMYRLGLDPTIEHEPSADAEREMKPITHVYAVARIKDADPVFMVLTKAQVDTYRKRSRASGSGPWVTDYVAMALKTVVRRLFTWIPQSTEMATAAAIDEAPERGISQLAVGDPGVLGVLEAHGVDTSEATGDVAVETGNEPAAS